MKRLLQVVACLVFIGPWLAPASEGEVVQVTNTPSGRAVGGASVDASGRWIVFSSTADVAGLNPTPVNNVFVYDVQENQFSRITSEGGNDPVISGDGRYVAFSSDANYTGRNEDGSEEIFRYDRVRRRFYQVTRDRLGDGSSVLPSIDFKGKRIAFETTSNLRGRNADFSNEVYFFNRSGNMPLSRDPEGEGESYTPAVAGDGSLVAFVSTSNLTGRNEDFSQELMIYDVKERVLYQATNDVEGFGESSAPAVSGNGRFVVFVSSSNLGGGDNPDNVSAVWIRRKSGYSSLVTTKMDGPFDAEQPTIDWDGEWIGFVAREDLVGLNPDRSAEIFLYNRQRKTFTQVTSHPPGCNIVGPKLTATGGRVVYRSNCDPLGLNPDRGYEVFWATNPAKHLVIQGRGNIELVVFDPSGRLANRLTTTIPLARYEVGDFDSNGVQDVRVTIPEAMEGRYRIQVLAGTGADPGEAAEVEASLSGVVVRLAEGTVGSLNGLEASVTNQSFTRRSSTLVPVAGTSSKATLGARIPYPMASSGPIEIRWSDGRREQSFPCGQIELLDGRGRFFGTVDGFSVALRLIARAEGAVSLRFTARGGDLSEFAGTDHLGMTVAVRLGPDAHVYNWRFTRSPQTGKLTLR
ncbi:Protein TolB [bacterium HR30]|nr:Protein TolB [bacterium HR30]